MARLDEHTLRNIAEVHVGYELERAAAMSGARSPDWDDTHLEVETAFLEAYLLHCRNLFDFLAKQWRPPRGRTGQEDHGVYAADYFDDPPAPNRWQPWPHTDQARLSKQLAHITTERLDPTVDGWALRPEDPDRSGWVKAAMDAVDGFLADLRGPHPHRAEWFDGRVARARVALTESADGSYVFARHEGRSTKVSPITTTTDFAITAARGRRPPARP